MEGRRHCYCSKEKLCAATASFAFSASHLSSAHWELKVYSKPSLQLPEHLGCMQSSYHASGLRSKMLGWKHYAQSLLALDTNLVKQVEQ